MPVAGAAAGAALSAVLAPTELVKCRVQMGQARSPLACVRAVVAEEGVVRGLSRGLGATLVREVPGNALFFTAYEALRRHVLPGRPTAAAAAADGGGRRGDDSGGATSSSPTASLSAYAVLLEVLRDAGSAIACGGLAGTLMWATVLPLDVAKTRIQTAHPGSPWDVGVARHLGMLWREGGARSLWAGLAPTLVRAFPANAAQWLAWELAMRQLPFRCGGGGGDDADY